MSTTVLIFLILLILVIAVVVWWYGSPEKPPRREKEQPASVTTPGHNDDLTVINGIGETLQKRLNEMGITTFKQIAELTESDITRINATLSFKGRIQREGWVAQAQKLVEAGSRLQAGGSTRKAPARKSTRKQGGRGTKVRKTSTGKAGRKSRKKA